MAEYIERENAIAWFMPYAHAGESIDADVVISDIKGMKAADVAPVVHGRWIEDNNSLQTDDYYCCYFDYNCSECGKVVNNRYELPKYCPNCGCRMDGGDDE